MGVLPRTTSTSFVEVGKPAVTMSNLMAQEEKERQGAQFRSKSVAWNEPMLLLQKMSSRKVGKAGSRSFRQKDGQEWNSRMPSKWTKFWRKLRLDGGKKVYAARPEWLNYDSQSYAMNFEEDMETPSGTSQLMPRISGPGAREIVTVLLTRSPTTNRNSGCILIPKPVISDVKQETNAPLWKRRSVSAPSPLDIRMRHPSMKRRISTGA